MKKSQINIPQEKKKDQEIKNIIMIKKKKIMIKISLFKKWISQMKAKR